MDDRVATLDEPLCVGERFARRVTFDDASIRRFATLCGDHNPLHHDAEVASRTAFGALIASGPHVTSLMMGLDATYLSGRGEALGLGFEFKFVKAVPAGTTLTLEWTITGIVHKPSLRGDIVSVEGRAIDDVGVVYVTSTGRNLVRTVRPAAGALSRTGETHC
jgi:acyl dehydratase